MKTIIILSAMCLFLASCSKEMSATLPYTKAEVKFQVTEEQNVASYTVQTSSDGVSWTNKAVITANLKPEYSATVDVTEYSSVFYTRISAKDLDGTITLSVTKINHL